MGLPRHSPVVILIRGAVVLLLQPTLKPKALVSRKFSFPVLPTLPNQGYCGSRGVLTSDSAIGHDQVLKILADHG